MEFSAVVGPSYRSQSIYASVEKCVNFYNELVEDPEESKTRTVLYPTPCTAALGPVLNNSPYAATARGLLELNGRLFGVNGRAFFEYTLPSIGNPFGTLFQWGTVLDDGNPVSMIANGVISPGNQQIFITSADHGYIFNTSTNHFSSLSLANSFIAGRGAAFLDDFFISIIPNTNGIQVSNQNDGTAWSSVTGQAVAYTQGQSDVLSNLIADHDYLYIFGKRRSEIFSANGSNLFPFSIQPGGFIEMGLGAQYALTQADNSIFFLGQDARGGRSFWRLNGLTPVRISNHGVETAIAKYGTISDCIMYSFTWRGHIFVRAIFPQARAGWQYDCTMSRQKGYAVWNEISFTDRNGHTFAPLERAHAYFNDIHVVTSGGAEGLPGSIYQFSDKTVIDSNPVMLLRYSDDGGNTFNEEIPIEVGLAGEYSRRAIADLLGSGRDRVYWLRCIDYGDGGGQFPIIRDRICPHIYHENKTIFYHRLEVEFQKGIGSEAGQTDQFWAIVNAYLDFSVGLV